MTVTAAGAALAAGQLDGRFAAIAGYWMQYALPCAFPVHEAIVGGYCNGGKFADTADGVSDPQAGVEFGIAPVAAPETVNADLLWSAGGSGPSPFPVVVIVHADDSRARQCIPDQQSDCRRIMVIDDVAWLNGSATAPGTTISESGVQPTMSLDHVTAIAVTPGEQLVTAYALAATHLNDVDPRLLGKGSGIVWLVRTVAADASGDGTVRLISDADGSVIDELPLTVSSDYGPSRLTLDSKTPDQNSASQEASYSLLQGQTTLASDILNMATTPIAVLPGDYVLRAVAGGVTCDGSITIPAGADVAYRATFTGSKCTWTPFDPSNPFL